LRPKSFIVANAWRNYVRKLIIAACLLASTSAFADGWNRHHHQRWNGHHHYRGGGGGGDWVGPAIGGLIIGGMLMNMAQPRQQYYQQQYCETVFLGRVWDGYRWVDQYQRICQ